MFDDDKPGRVPDTDSVLADLRHDAEAVPEEMKEWWLQYLDGHRAHYRVVLSLLPAAGMCRVLEVGCFPGQLSKAITGLGHAADFVDLAPDRLQAYWARNRIDVRPCDVEREPLPYGAETFDYVLFTEIIEHLRVNPLHALREVCRVLKPGGHVLLSTPNITPVQRFWFLLGRDYQGDPVVEFQRLETLGHMGHLRLYSKREVVRLLLHTGLNPERCLFRGHRTYRGVSRVIASLYPCKRHLRARLYVVAAKARHS
jgi:SAM-dependent methyltransferase